MMRKISPLEKMVSLSILFTMVLLLARICYVKELTYGFYVWNTFLAVLPLLFSRALLKRGKPNFAAFVLLGCWLAFFPNAAYMVTDMLHYKDAPPVPYWFDLLLVASAAWNGLLLGILSLMYTEQFLRAHFKAKWVKLLVLVSFVLCGYGVYIGRFLRFNSWDVISRPGQLMYVMGGHFFKPHHHLSTWSFTLLFGGMFGIIYFTLKQFTRLYTEKPAGAGNF